MGQGPPGVHGAESLPSATSGHWRADVPITCPDKRGGHRGKHRNREVSYRSSEKDAGKTQPGPHRFAGLWALPCWTYSNKPYKKVGKEKCLETTQLPEETTYRNGDKKRDATSGEGQGGGRVEGDHDKRRRPSEKKRRYMKPFKATRT